MRRRDFLLGSTAALGLAGCGRTAVPRPPSPVNITRAAAYSQDIYDTMRRVLAEHKLNGRGRRVVIETQPGGVRARKRHQPHPMLVHATLEAFRELGAAVAIAEGPGHRRSTLDLAAAAGYFPPALALAAYRARERPAGLHAQDEDATLGGRHAFDEEPVRHSPRRSLRLAQECAALGRHPPEHCGPALAVSESLRDCGWDRGDGWERTDSGAAQAGGRDRIRARPGGGGRHLLPDHADRAVAHRVPNIGGRLRRNCRGKYPANRRKAGFRGDAV